MESAPIVGEAEEVKEAGEQKRRGRPKKEDAPQKEANEILLTLTTVANAVRILGERFEALSERIGKVEKYTESMVPVESPTLDVVVKPAEIGKEDVLILAVQKILGQGDPHASQFQVFTEPERNGRNFMLTIIPPRHLREIADEEDANGKAIIMDKRQKVFSYNEGVSGAENYTKIVFKRCVDHANRNAISYFDKG